jgi:hypothetical protein
MTTQEAIKILKSHNRWRQGEDIPAVCPVMLGEAIDQAVKELEIPASFANLPTYTPACDQKKM